MALPIEDDTLRTAAGAAGVTAALVVFTEYTLRSLAPVLLLSAGLLAYGAVDEAYDLPRGSNAAAFGVGLVAAGAFVAIEGAIRAGGAVVVVGCWFALDGATTARYGPVRTPHRFVSGPEPEAMLRMWILNAVHRRLRERDGPHTAAELADACDLAEPRVASALEYLERRGQADRTGDGYHAAPRNWGRATPAVRFLAWLPRRTVRPFHRVYVGLCR